MFTALLTLHMTAAAVACVSMLVPVLARKGGIAHRYVGHCRGDGKESRVEHHVGVRDRTRAVLKALELGFI